MTASPYGGGDPYADYRTADFPFTGLADLADRRLGAGVVAANDEFFAERENLLKPEAAEFDPEHFGHKGQGHGRLGDPPPPRVSAEQPTPPPRTTTGPSSGSAPRSHPRHRRRHRPLRGNYPQAVSVEGASVPGSPSPEELLGPDVEWTTLVPRTAIGGHGRRTASPSTWSGVSRTCASTSTPDGGIARLRVYGEVAPDPSWLGALGTFDVAALENGGSVEDASDRFYSPATNTIQPGRSRKMDDGWETRRRRDRGNDWIRYRLAEQAEIRAVEIDTAYLKGQHSARLGRAVRPRRRGREWTEFLPRTRLQPDTNHRFVLPNRAVAHPRPHRHLPRRRHLAPPPLRLPDGGGRQAPHRPPPGARG